MNLIGVQDWERVQERWEAWWHGDIVDRPLIKITAPRGGPAPEVEEPPRTEEEVVRWFTDGEAILRRIDRAIERTYYAGDAFPLAFPVNTHLVASEAAYLGCPYRFAVESMTAWHEPIIEDWDNPPEIRVDPDNYWWKVTRELLALGAEHSVSDDGVRYVVGIPDLQGGGQIAVMLRGTERMAVDLVDHPEPVKEVIAKVNAAWLTYYNQCFEIIHRRQDGWVDNLGMWSSTPAVCVECDFAALISPRMFDEFFMPALADQTRWVGRTVYHLDGPRAIPHLPSLLELPTLNGIQWQPGASRLEVAEWIPLLQRIQAGGKLIVLACAPSEVQMIYEALKPEGLMLSTRCDSVQEADALLEMVSKRYGGRR